MYTFTQWYRVQMLHAALRAYFMSTIYNRVRKLTYFSVFYTASVVLELSQIRYIQTIGLLGLYVDIKRLLDSVNKNVN